MIDHVTIPVRDLEVSRKFYDKAFVPLQFHYSFGEEGFFCAYDLKGKGLFEFSRNELTTLTPVHIAFRVESRALVDEFHAAAIKAGARDNGAPGPRPQYTPNYYACFVLDPDGHNIEAMHDSEA